VSIERIFEVNNEFQSIFSVLAKAQYEIIETKELLEIRINSGITKELLLLIHSKVKSFQVYCNPLSLEFSDIIHEINIDLTSHLSEITDVSIQFDKDDIIAEIELLDYLFFNVHSALTALKDIDSDHKEFKINIGIPMIENVQTKLINFVGLTEKTIINDISLEKIDDNIQKNIEFFLSNNKNSLQNMNYNPYAFLIEGDITESNLTSSLKEEFYLKLIESLSDKRESNYYVIRGEKNVSILDTNPYTTKNYTHLVDIFLFLISEQKYTEKYIITKKVLTLYLNDHDDISSLDEKLPDIWKTINHYYDHYVEDNIKEFFKTKDQLLKEAMNVSKVIYEQTDKITNSIIASILSILIIFVTTLYRSITNITLSFGITVFLFFLSFSFFYYYLMRSSSQKRYQLCESQFMHFISEISMIQKKELEKIKEIYLKKPYSELENTLTLLLTVIIIINCILLIFVFILLAI
jgi:hypothetical protein